MDPTLKPGLPAEIQLEPTIDCNLDCVMCNTESRNRRKRLMTLAEFRRIIARFPKLKRVTLHGIGEPLLNPSFVEMVGYLKRRGVVVFFNTNMTLMDGKTAKRLLALGVDEIRASLDTPYRDEYLGIRGKDMFDEVVGNIRRLVLARNGLKSKTKIRIVAVAMEENIESLPELARLAVKLGVDELLVQNMQYWAGNRDFAKRRRGKRADEKFDRIYGKCNRIAGKRLAFKMPHTGVAHTCNWPWTSCFITVEGEVTPCCNITDPRTLSFGSVVKKGLKPIWWGRRYESLRRRLASGKNIPRLCKGCVIYEGRFKQY